MSDADSDSVGIPDHVHLDISHLQNDTTIHSLSELSCISPRGSNIPPVPNASILRNLGSNKHTRRPMVKNIFAPLHEVEDVASITTDSSSSDPKPRLRPKQVDRSISVVSALFRNSEVRKIETTDNDQVDPNSRAHNELIDLPERLNVQLNKLDKIDQLDKRYRWQLALYNFLNRPSHPLALAYHIVLSIIFVVYVFIVIFTSRTTWRYTCVDYTRKQTLKAYFEYILVAYAYVEFIARFWSSRILPQYIEESKRKWLATYFIRPSHIFDLLLIISGSVAVSCQVASFDYIQDVYALIAIRGLHRLWNVARWTSVQTRVSVWVLMTEVFQEGGFILFALFYLELLVIFITAYIVFIAEHYSGRKDAVIHNMVDSIYCLTITLLTIGLGDFSPVTYVGQAATGIGIWIALTLFCLPPGLIATSVAVKINHYNEKKNRKLCPRLAAILIQRWFRYMRRQKRFELSCLLASNGYNRPSTSSQTSIRLDEKLCAKIEYIVEHRSEFYVSQFIQLLLIATARKQFRQVVTTDVRPLMKTYWSDHKQLTELLDIIHKELDKNVIELEERLEQEYRLSVLESKLETLEKLTRDQHRDMSTLI